MAQEKKSLKSGWLLVRPGWGTVPTMRFAFAALLLAATTTADAAMLAVNAAPRAATARIVFAGGSWAAIDFGARCEARSKALWAKVKTEPYAGFAFDRLGARQGQFYVHLSRPARPGATVIATIGSQPFLLASSGQWGWSRNVAQQSAMMAAARSAGGMRVESRDIGGRRIIDRYDLSGAPTAIDAAAAACAGKKG